MSIARAGFFLRQRRKADGLCGVIGATVATNLFQGGSPLGNKVKIAERAYEVVGILEKQGSFMDGGSVDNQAIIPLPQFVTFFWSDPIT